MADNQQDQFRTQKKTPRTVTELVAYPMTALQTQSSLRSVWTGGLWDCDLEEKLFELNLKN